MTNPQKRKGSAFELAVARYLTSVGIQCERTRAGWADDRGDLDGPDLAGWAVECKATKAIDLAGAVDEAVIEATHKALATRRRVRPVAVIKRRGKPVSDAYCVLPLSAFAEILKENP